MRPEDDSRKVDIEQATIQWTDLHHKIIRAGGYVQYIEPGIGQPDMVFVANAGLVHRRKVVLSRFRHNEREGEEFYFYDFFKNLGYDIFVPKQFFEGAGDSFVLHHALFLGHGFRSDPATAKKIRSFLKVDYVVLFKLINPLFYHLDTCLCPLDGTRKNASNPMDVLYVREAFDDSTIRQFEDLVHFRFHAIDMEESLKFACNAVVIGNTVIMPNGCPKTGELLTSLGYRVICVAMSEFLKAGGACKCLTLNL